MERNDMDTSAGCAPRTLAASAVGQVLRCGHCGQLHLELGPVTLRLTPDAFGELAELVLQARRQLQAQAHGAVAVPVAPALH